MSLVLYRDGNGLGDDLFLTAIARDLAGEGRKPWVSTNRPDLWTNNPDIRGHLPVRLMRWPSRLAKRRVISMRYEESPRENLHFIQRLACLVGLDPGKEYTPAIYLDDAEEQYGIAHARDAILIQTDAKNVWTSNKNWFMDRFQDVARECLRYGRVLQVGMGQQPKLEGAEDWRNRTNVREIAALLKAAKLFVGLEGGLMHIASAMGTPSIIIYGGYISPRQSGYSSQTNFYSPVECAPCLLRTPCPYDMKCMKEITADRVIAAVRAAMQGKA